MKKIYFLVLICLITFQITRAQVHPYSQCAPHAIVEYPEDYDYHRIECFIEYKSFNSVTLYWGMHDAVGTPICTQIAKMDFSSGEWEAIATLSGDVYSYTVDELEVGGHAYRISILYDHGIVYISDPARLSFGIEPYQIFKDLSYSYPENNLDYIIFQWKVLGTLPLYYTLECNGEILKDHSFEDDMKFPGDQSFIEVYNRSKDEPCVYRIWSMNESGERIQQVGNDIVLDLNSWKAPRNFHAITNDNGYIELRWTMHPDIPYCQYQIERDGEIIATILTDEEYRYEDVNLEMEEGNIHIYRLYIPDCDDGVSLDIFTDVVVKIGEYRPPINFAVQKEDSRAYLTWDLPGGAIRPMYYVIERNGVIIGETGENMYYDDEEYESGIRIYKLYAIHDNGTVFTVTTSSEEWTIALSPTNFSYTIENRNNVVFTWSMHPQGKKPDYYQIRKNGNNIAVLQENVSTYIDANVSIGTYVYELYAYYDNGEIKEAENRLTIEITPAIIENFTYTIEDYNNVLLSWEVPGNGVPPESYQIKKGEEVIAELPGGSRSFRDMDLEYGTYIYRIIIRYANGYIVELESTLEVIIEEDGYALPINFIASVGGNNVALMWNILEEGKRPRHYILKRDDIVIATLGNDTFLYYDPGLEIGIHEYHLYAKYRNDSIFEADESITVTINEITGEAYNIPEIFYYDIDTGGVILYWDIFELETSISPQYYWIKRDDSILVEIPNNVFTYYDQSVEIGNTYTYTLWSGYENVSEIKTPEEITVTIKEISDNIVLDEGVVFLTHYLDDGVSEHYLAPINFSHAIEGNNVSLAWELPERGIEPQYYELRRNGEFLIQIDGNLRSYVDYGLEEGTFVYVLSAYYDNGNFFKVGVAVCPIKLCF